MKEYLTTNIRKEQIIDAVQKIVTNKGSEYVTVRNIAKEVKITEAAIYRHFKSKRDIFLFLTKQIAKIYINDIDKIFKVI